VKAGRGGGTDGGWGAGMVGSWDQGADEKTSVWRTGFLFLTAAFPGGWGGLVYFDEGNWQWYICCSICYMKKANEKRGDTWADEVNIDATRVGFSQSGHQDKTTKRKISLRQLRHDLEQLRHIRRAQARRCADRVALSDRGYQVKHHT